MINPKKKKKVKMKSIDYILFTFQKRRLRLLKEGV